MTPNPAPSISQLRLITIALLIGPLLFAAVVGWLVTMGTFDGPRMEGPVPLVLVAVAASNLVLAVFLRGLLHAKVSSTEPAGQPARYATAALTYFALLESSMLISVVTWLLAREPLPALLPGGAAFVLALLTLPSEEHFEAVKR
jgi:hypothetical protein